MRLLGQLLVKIHGTVGVGECSRQPCVHQRRQLAQATVKQNTSRCTITALSL